MSDCCVDSFVNDNVVGLLKPSGQAAPKFILAAGITDGNQRSAVNYLVNRLMANNLWTKIHCLYPFVGGTASSHSYNLINPSLFQITWFNSPVHNANGVEFNGTNNYGATGFISSANMTLNDTGFHLYSRTIGQVGSTRFDMGAATAPSNRFAFQIATLALQMQTAQYGATVGALGGMITPNTTTHGFFSGNRPLIDLCEHYINGVLQAPTNTTTNTSVLVNRDFYLGCTNSGIATLFSSKQHALTAFTKGMTAAEMLIFYNIVQQYQTILNRQV